MGSSSMDDALWALGRGTGVAALVLLTVSLLLGVLTRSGRPGLGLPRFAVTEVHRSAALLATSFVAVHVVSLLFDPYAQLRLVDVLVPFLGAHESFWQGLGTVALDLLTAVVVTSLLRHRIGLRVWRALHWSTYALWPVAFAHGLGNGSDYGAAWFFALNVFCALAVVGALAWRVRGDFVEFQSSRLPLGQTSLGQTSLGQTSVRPASRP